MNHLELIAVERFAKKLKIDFPILEKPKDFSDRITNMHNEHTHRIIDIELKNVRLDFDLEAAKEAKEYEKD